MHTCGTCKHLGKAITDWDDDYHNQVPTGYHECALLDLRRKEQKVPPPLAYAQDGSDYRAVLCVKAEFGCVEWEQRHADTREVPP